MVLLIGDLTIDHNHRQDENYIGPGGSVYFAANIFNNLGLKPVIISSYGLDYSKRWLGNIDLYPQKPNATKTLLFQNIYKKNGVRNQYVKNQESAKPVDLHDIPNKIISESQIIFFAPLLTIYKKDYFQALLKLGNKKLKVFLPQGMFRKVMRQGRVKKTFWKGAETIIPDFDIVVFSKEDIENADSLGAQWSSLGPLVIVTKDREGCSIYERGERLDLPASKVRVIKDETGAGDIFAAGFAFFYFKTKDARKSGIFANIFAGLSLRFHSDRLKYIKINS